MNFIAYKHLPRQHLFRQIHNKVGQPLRVAGRAHVGQHGLGSCFAVAFVESLDDVAVLLE